MSLNLDELAHLYKTAAHDGCKVANTIDGDLLERLSRARDFIDHCYDHPRSLDQISEKACFSRYHFLGSFSSLFHKSVGHAPMVLSRKGTQDRAGEAASAWLFRRHVQARIRVTARPPIAQIT